ncbi:MAG: class I SAM-dependent rRNA methyltransferase, partial [Candidatus Rokuibacteriota bacterium]
VWSEADGLPGLVVDRYRDVLVAQCLTLGMAGARAEIVAALQAALGDLPVFGMDDVTAAKLEGFPPARGWLDRPGPPATVVDEDGVTLGVTFGTGHKTGLYLDQRENRLRAGTLAAGRDMLDVFSYTGGFACHALAGGAVRTLCLESSPEAIAGARENLDRNGAGGRAEIVDGNAFDALRLLAREGRRFGLVVLDPPPFARARTALDAAARGYKEINLRAMRLLAPGGHLLTFSCSHHVSAAFFEEVCRDAAADAGVTLRVVAPLGQASDHPVLLTVPETRYLKGWLLEAL